MCPRNRERYTPNIVVRNVPGGGAAWTIARGEAQLDQDGTLKVEVEGLVLVATGVNPVGQFFATLSCLNANGTENNISTSAVQATSTGNATIEEALTLPSTCLAPIVLVRGVIPARGNPWFAVSGF